MFITKKTKVETALNLRASLIEVINNEKTLLPVKLAYKISRQFDKVDSVSSFYDKEKAKLLKPFMVDGEVKPEDMSEEDVEKANKLITKLLKSEIDVEMLTDKISISEFGEPCEISPKVLYNISELLE